MNNIYINRGWIPYKKTNVKLENAFPAEGVVWLQKCKHVGGYSGAQSQRLRLPGLVAQSFAMWGP